MTIIDPDTGKEKLRTFLLVQSALTKELARFRIENLAKITM